MSGDYNQDITNPGEECVVDLTDTEWMDLIDPERPGLPRCCANISALRDVIINIARESGRVGVFGRGDLGQKAVWVMEGHELTPAVKVFLEKAGFDLDELQKIADLSNK